MTTTSSILSQAGKPCQGATLTCDRSWIVSLFACLLCGASITLRAEIVSIDIAKPSAPETGYFKLGTAKNPAGQSLSVNSRSMLIDGKPVFPVMGEIHYARVPQAEWRDELLKMKEGGVNIIASYVFWIYHEEVQGQWDWTGQRDLRKFISTCRELGLKVVVRCGPWCHGEARNGGFPDWVQKSGWGLRSTDPNFLAAVKVLFAQIAGQLRGELWKDGGPVIGIQLDNEFGGTPDYLLALKHMAIEAGMDVPFYNKTGWPAMETPPPLGEFLPLFGAYPDGFWARSIQPMDENSWQNFTFKIQRTDTGVGNDTLKVQKIGDTSGTEKYPYFTCEIGGGMPASYHRRINYDKNDVESVVLCQLGSGSSMLGYYMYHGGQNPDGTLSTLNESTASGYGNDLPVKSYDFNAPIGEFGQINPQYYWLRRLHMFLRDFGGDLAPMPAFIPTDRVKDKTDTETLRWSVRTDGNRGYVFVNNYQRLQPMGAKANVQFKLNLPGGELLIPRKPGTIPADSFFYLPFNMDLNGAKLTYATAQPICRQGDSFFFAEIPGVPAEFVFEPKSLKSSPAEYHALAPDRNRPTNLVSATGKPIRIILLNEADSLAVQKIGVRISFDAPATIARKSLETTLIRDAGPAREIPLVSEFKLAAAPTDEDFASACVWKIKMPGEIDLAKNPLLRIHYIGDVARLTLNGKLIADNFYAGRPFDLGLKRYGKEILTGDLRLEILPLRKDAPIYIEPKNRPDFGTSNTLLKIDSVEILQ